MKKSLFVFLLAGALTFSAYSQTKAEDIARLLEITNTKTQAAQMFDLMIPALRSMAPDVPEAFWTMFKSKLDLNSFIDLFIPVYDKHFSHEDIKEMLRFYETPAGKRLLEVTPLITRESYSIGEVWGQKIGEDVVDELIRQGYE